MDEATCIHKRNDCHTQIGGKKVNIYVQMQGKGSCAPSPNSWPILQLEQGIAIYSESQVTEIYEWNRTIALASHRHSMLLECISGN